MNYLFTCCSRIESRDQIFRMLALSIFFILATHYAPSWADSPEDASDATLLELGFEDHYATIGVPRNASPEVILQTYERRKADFIEHYPDYVERQFPQYLVALETAFSVLSNPVLKAQHDRDLRARAEGFKRGRRTQEIQIDREDGNLMITPLHQVLRKSGAYKEMMSLLIPALAADHDLRKDLNHLLSASQDTFSLLKGHAICRLAVVADLASICLTVTGVTGAEVPALVIPSSAGLIGLLWAKIKQEDSFFGRAIAKALKQQLIIIDDEYFRLTDANRGIVAFDLMEGFVKAGLSPSDPAFNQNFYVYLRAVARVEPSIYQGWMVRYLANERAPWREALEINIEAEKDFWREQAETVLVKFEAEGSLPANLLNRAREIFGSNFLSGISQSSEQPSCSSVIQLDALRNLRKRR